MINEGLGDTIVFNAVIDKIKPDIIACCYPDVFEDFKGEIISIAEAQNRYGDIERFNLYHWMDKNNWKGELKDAYITLYK